MKKIKNAIGNVFNKTTDVCLRKKIMMQACSVIASIVLIGTSASAEDIAYVEEIIVHPDGSEQIINSYRPSEQRTGQQRFDVPESYSQKEPRGLRPHEQQELDRIESDFEQGRMTANEYYLRKNKIYSSLQNQSGNQGDGSISYQY